MDNWYSKGLMDSTAMSVKTYVTKKPPVQVKVTGERGVKDRDNQNGEVKSRQIEESDFESLDESCDSATSYSDIIDDLDSIITGYHVETNEVEQAEEP